MNINRTMESETYDLINIGNSIGLTLNKGAMKVYGIRAGDKVEIIYDWPKIIIQKVKETDKHDSSN